MLFHALATERGGRISPASQTIRDITGIGARATRPLQIPIRCQTSTIIQPCSSVIPTDIGVALLLVVLPEPGAPCRSIRAVEDLLVDLGLRAGKLNVSGHADSGIVVIAGTSAVVGLHQPWIRVIVGCCNNTDASGRLLNNDGEDESRIDSRGRIDGKDCLSHLLDFFRRVVRDAPLLTRDLYIRFVVLEPGGLLLVLSIRAASGQQLKHVTYI